MKPDALLSMFSEPIPDLPDTRGIKSTRSRVKRFERDQHRARQLGLFRDSHTCAADCGAKATFAELTESPGWIRSVPNGDKTKTVYTCGPACAATLARAAYDRQAPSPPTPKAPDGGYEAAIRPDELLDIF